MKNIANNSLITVMRQVTNAGNQLKVATDQYTIKYWQAELNKALNLKMRIETRFKVRYNVVYIDFKAKKRVA